MLFERLSKLIDAAPIRRLVDRQRELVEKTDPDRIYVENVRAFFKLPHPLAYVLCEAAVREGFFKGRVGVLCPSDEHIVASYESEADIPDVVHCRVCEFEGRPEMKHETGGANRIKFYQLVGRHDG